MLSNNVYRSPFSPWKGRETIKPQVADSLVVDRHQGIINFQTCYVLVSAGRFLADFFLTFFLKINGRVVLGTSCASM